MKKTLYILIILAVIAVAAFAAYQFLYHGGGATAPSTGSTGSLPGAATQQFPAAGQSTTTSAFNTSGANASSSKFGIVSNDPALDYFVNSANVVTLVEPNGVIESISNNTTSTLSTSTISNIINTSFSYDGKKILINSAIGTTTQTLVFDLSSQAWTLLPNGMRSPVWSPKNDQIAYLTMSNLGVETLNTINLASAISKPVAIASLNMEDMALQWPSQNTIIISDRPSAFTVGSIWKFTVSSQKLSPVVYENFGIESLWDTSGAGLIFIGGPHNAGGSLIFQNASGGQNTLSFGTLPSKCTFATATTTTSTAASAPLIYCAAPNDQNMFSLARLPDEYDQKIYFTNDNFYRVDTGTGALNEIFSYASANQNIDATNLKIFNNILFFINRYDQKIYALAL